MDNKRLTDLVTNDLLDKQVWEHWINNDIEYVRPSNKNQISETDNVGHIVLTDFILSNGTKLTGFCSLQDTSGLDYIQPTIFTDKGHFKIFKENNWTIEEKEKELKKLNLIFNQVFPINFVSRIKFNGQFYRGTILDFNRGE